MQKIIHNQSYKSLVKWLKKSRESQSITMRELADKMQVQHSIIWNIENCERRLDILEYQYYCEALNIDYSTGIDITKNTN